MNRNDIENLNWVQQRSDKLFDTSDFYLYKGHGSNDSLVINKEDPTGKVKEIIVFKDSKIVFKGYCKSYEEFYKIMQETGFII